jgi:hypothetical protein
MSYSRGVAGFVRDPIEKGTSMKTLMGAVALSLLAWGSAPANAATVVLGGQNWTLGGTNLGLVATPTPTANQPKDAPCLICGGNQPQQPATFGYNDFGNTGNKTDLAFFSSGIFKDTLASDTISGTNYSGAFLSNYLLSKGDLDLTFSVGVDMNDTNKAQTLESFFFLNLTQQTVLASYSPGPGGTLLPSIHNGTGYADYLLTGLTLQGIAPGDQLAFYSRISGANDGPDSFFLQANVSPVPLPAALPLFGTAVGGLLLLKRRRHRNSTPA